MGPILVTGAAGFAGSHLLDLLTSDASETPTPIVGWYHPSGEPPTTFPGATAPGVSWHPIDLGDRDAVRDAVARVRPSEIYHLAGAASQGHSWERADQTLHINVMGTAHLLDAVRLAGLPSRTLIVSSATVYRPCDRALDEDAPIGPTSPYALSKLAQELVALQGLHRDDAPVLIVRAFNHIGPRQGPDFVAASFARQLAAIEAGRRDPVLEVGNLEARRDLMDVRDTVRAYRAIMQRGAAGQPYNVCSGQAIAIGDLLDELIRRTKVRVEVRQDPARLRPSDQPIVLGCHDRVTHDTGWRPEIPMTRTLGDLLDYWRAQDSA